MANSASELLADSALIDNVNHAPHYEIYPVQPIQITRYLGFCLGNMTKHVLRAPYKGGVEDCDKAMYYHDLELARPQTPLYYQDFKCFRENIDKLMEWLNSATGDALWDDIADLQALFIDCLGNYVFSLEVNRSYFDSVFLKSMRHYISELRRVLALRDTVGEIYEGMTGLPKRENRNGEN